MAKGLHMALERGHRSDTPPAFVSKWDSIGGGAAMAPPCNGGMQRSDVERFGHVIVLIE